MQNPAARQAQQIEALQSFKAGVLTALVALKAAIQVSPAFNRQALEDCATFFLAAPAEGADFDVYALPLRTLCSDHAALLRETCHRECFRGDRMGVGAKRQ